MAFLYPWKGSSVAIRAPARKSSPRSASQFLRTVPDLPGTRSTQAGRGMILPTCQVHDASEFTWVPAASVLVVPHVLIDPQYPNPCEAGGVIRCGLQARLDMGPHGIPRGFQLSSQSCNGGSLEAQLSDRPADRPHTQTRPGPCAITPHPGHPTSWLHDSTSSTRAPGVRATLIRWKPSKPTSRSHRSQRSSDTAQQVR